MHLGRYFASVKSRRLPPLSHRCRGQGMPTSNIINRGTWWSSGAPLISLTRPLPTRLHHIFGLFFRTARMPCYAIRLLAAAYLALVLTSSYHNSIWGVAGRWDPGRYYIAWGTISATNDQDFSVFGISDRPSVSYERRHLGRSWGILSLLWSLIKTDKIIGHQALGGVLPLADNSFGRRLRIQRDVSSASSRISFPKSKVLFK